MQGYADRLEDVELSLPLVELDWYEEEDDEGEPDPWLVATATVALGEREDGVRRGIAAADDFFRSLAEQGTIRVVFAADEDAELPALIETLKRTKGERPADAVDMALTAAARCRAAGDFWLGAYVDMLAAEILGEMGAMTQALALSEPAWEVLGRPVDDTVIVVGYAGAIAAAGDHDAALDLLTEAEEVAEDPADIAFLRLNRAILFFRCSRLPEAIPILEAILAEPFLADIHRPRAIRALADARGTFGGAVAVPPLERIDILENVDDELDEVAQLVVTSPSRASINAELPSIAAVLRRVSAKWDRLGPGQRARLLITEGVVAYVGGDLETAGEKLRAGQAIALATGDADFIRQVAASMASIPGALGHAGQRTEPPPGASPLDRMAFYFNRAFHLISTATAATARQVAGRALPDALAAVLAVDEASQHFAAIADRRAFADLGHRSYALALTLAANLDRPSLALELLERIRAQGVPAETGAARIEGALGDLVVTRPSFATVSGRSELEPERATVRLADAAARIAGRWAWWWACQPLGPTVAWALWSRGSGPMAGLFDLDERTRQLLEKAGALFEPPSAAADLPAYLLAGDRNGRLEATLARLAQVMLPPRLAQAARAAAKAGETLRLIWSPPGALGGVPVGLLPIGGGLRLLHGAAVTLAPPTSLLPPVDAPPIRRQAQTVRETVVLGKDDGLTAAAAIVGPAGLDVDPLRVLGAPRHLAGGRPLAASLATPDAVRTFWSAPAPELALYYGHIDEPHGGSPLTVSLRLSDGHTGSAPLAVSALLTPERRGAPTVAVLCGCSSLGASAAGSGERWGFAAALLWQGSQHVLGSLWSLVDGPATARFTVELVTRLRSRQDPAMALHELQLAWLQAWERGTDGRDPVIWAGWAVTGAGGR